MAVTTPMQWISKCQLFFILLMLSAAAQSATGLTSAPCIHKPGNSPEMVIIPGGTFLMGSAADEPGAEANEQPQRNVTVQPFALGRCEVTVAEFSEFVTETGYRSDAEQNDRGCVSFNRGEIPADLDWQNPGFPQTPLSPVTCVTWRDAQAYIKWLSMRTGVAYRLPGEAEWEYAARAGTTGAFATGDCIDGSQANFNATVQYSDCPTTNLNSGQTVEVAQYAANDFGLYDMHGNVVEWTQDCWHDNYQGAPSDGRAWLGAGPGNCERRVLRGGSWLNFPQFSRSANRFRFYLLDSNNIVGFRIARTLQ